MMQGKWTNINTTEKIPINYKSWSRKLNPPVVCCDCLHCHQKPTTVPYQRNITPTPTIKSQKQTNKTNKNWKRVYNISFNFLHQIVNIPSDFHKLCICVSSQHIRSSSHLTCCWWCPLIEWEWCEAVLFTICSFLVFSWEL